MTRFAFAVACAVALGVAGSALAQGEMTMVLEVHKDATKDALFSRVATLSAEGAFDWGAPTRIAKSRSHGVGFDGHVAVLINEDDDDTAKLNCRVGTADAKAMAVTWGEPVAFGKGQKPSVRVMGTKVICAYQGSKEDRLWIVIGDIQVERKQVTWGTPVLFEEAGRNVDID